MRRRTPPRTSQPRVGVRELRQNLSVYLRRVTSGETLEVTERGRAIAVLAPIPDDLSALGRLVGAGRANRPSGKLLDLGAPRGRASRRVGRALDALREDRV